MIVKVCGITRPSDAVAAGMVGVDWIGINFWPQSKRWVSDLSVARQIAESARDNHCQVVGVFVNQDSGFIGAAVNQVGLDIVQLHGDEDKRFLDELPDVPVCKAFALSGANQLDELWGDFVLVDAPQAGYGGGGHVASWQLAGQAAARQSRLILAGGLAPNNVAEAISAVKPWGVDVASGVESGPGLKDETKMRCFVAAAKGES